LNSTQVFLLSLKWPPDHKAPSTDNLLLDDLGSYHTAKPVRELWKWKDQILGDGRDFFVPKPKTLTALQDYILRECPSFATKMRECVIVSNCARFEVIVYCSGDELDTEQLTNEISLCLTSQMDSYATKLRQKSGGWEKILTAVSLSNSADRPDDVLTTQSPFLVTSSMSASIPLSFWQLLVGSEQILPHLCRVAMGMAPRPRRPERPVLFRPFSSRDAHILLQLKRTREIAVENLRHVQKVTNDDQRSSKVLPLLLEYALRAGKAARNPAIVPEILGLRNEYRASTSSASAQEQAQSDEIAKIAYSRAAHPLVQEYLERERLCSSNVNQEITHLRKACLAMVQRSGLDTIQRQQLQKEVQWMNEKLHGLTMELRKEGRLMSFATLEDCITAIKKELDMIRQREGQMESLVK
jgi:hypothetical protein